MSEDSGDGKVIDIEEAKGNLKRGRVGKATKTEEMSAAQLFETYVGILDKNNSYIPIKEQFKVYRTSAGDKLPLYVDDKKVCSVISTELIANALTEYWRQNYPTNDNLFLNPRKAEQVVTHWIRGSKGIPEPKSILWADEDDYCYRRLPFTYNSAAAFPAVFFELLDRLTNAAAFCSFIGSLFYEQSNRQQYVWIYGDGNNGKGSLSRFLHRVFNGAYAALAVPGRDGGARFWNNQLLNIRLGFFNECSSPKFPTSAPFKTLTGNDPITVEKKGKDSITAKINTKFIFTSNERPVLSNETADHRRAIICELKTFVGDEDPNYDEKLWNEAQDILSYCCRMYADHAAKNGHKSISVKAEDLLQYSAEEDDRFESIFSQEFVLSHGDYVSAQKFGHVMREIFRNRSHEERQFRMWLRRNAGVMCQVVWCNGVSQRRYPGIKVNSTAGMDPHR